MACTSCGSPDTTRSVHSPRLGDASPHGGLRLGRLPRGRRPLVQAHLPNTLLLDNALATMGAGLPSAIAAKIIHPDRQVVAIAGDGGFMMNSQELITAVGLKLNLVVIIINDNGMERQMCRA